MTTASLVPPAPSAPPTPTTAPATQAQAPATLALSALRIPAPSEIGRPAYMAAYRMRRLLKTALLRAAELKIDCSDLKLSDYTELLDARKAVRERIKAANKKARYARKAAARRDAKWAAFRAELINSEIKYAYNNRAVMECKIWRYVLDTCKKTTRDGLIAWLEEGG